MADAGGLSSPRLAAAGLMAEYFIVFQLIAEVLWPATSLFWLAIGALINPIASCDNQLFSAKKLF